MILHMIEGFIRLFTDLTLPAVPPQDTPLAPSDGRKFAWVRVQSGAGLNPIHPVIVFDDGRVGPQLDYITPPRVLTPDEYSLSLTELAARYPVSNQEGSMP